MKCGDIEHLTQYYSIHTKEMMLETKPSSEALNFKFPKATKNLLNKILLILRILLPLSTNP
jgi:hypothetical protein